MFINEALVTGVMLGFVGFALSGCAIQRAQDAADAKTQMVGLRKEAVLRCMGPPANSAVVGATEVWSYNSGNGQTDTVDFANAWGTRGFAGGVGSGVSTSRFCKIDIVMQSERVTQVNYSGPTGGLLTKGEQCAFAVENCVRQAAADALTPAPPPQIGTPSPTAN